MILERIISGGQNGADVAGLKAAIAKGIPTGGCMPNGFRTLDGPRPEYAQLYGMTEHASYFYPPRTFQNIKESDATLRIAHNLESTGEKCTLKGINQYNKPHFDVWVRDPNVFTVPEHMYPNVVAKWICDNDIKVLNVAGNSENTAPGIEKWVTRFISAVIDEVKKIEDAIK